MKITDSMVELFNLILDKWETVLSVPTLAPGELHLWYLKIPDESTELAPGNGCSPAEIAQAATINNPQIRLKFLYTHALRRRILGSYLNVIPELLQFQSGPNGKPHIAWPQPAPQFNLSHTGTLFLLAVIWDTEIGLDVEWLRPRTEILAIARRVFAPILTTQLSKLPTTTQTQQFYYHWTRHEAAIKARGDGLFNNTSEHTGLMPIYVNFIPSPGFQGCIAAYAKLPALNNWRMLKFE